MIYGLNFCLNDCCGNWDYLNFSGDLTVSILSTSFIFYIYIKYVLRLCFYGIVSNFLLSYFLTIDLMLLKDLLLVSISVNYLFLHYIFRLSSCFLCDTLMSRLIYSCSLAMLLCIGELLLLISLILLMWLIYWSFLIYKSQGFLPKYIF